MKVTSRVVTIIQHSSAEQDMIMITNPVPGAREIATTKDHRSRIGAASETIAKKESGLALATEEGAKTEKGTGAAVSDHVAIMVTPIGNEIVGKIKTRNVSF